MICTDCKLSSNLIGDTEWIDGRCPGCDQGRRLAEQFRDEAEGARMRALYEQLPAPGARFIDREYAEDAAAVASPFYPGTLVRR